MNDWLSTLIYQKLKEYSPYQNIEYPCFNVTLGLLNEFLATAIRAEMKKRINPVWLKHSLENKAIDYQKGKISWGRLCHYIIDDVRKALGLEVQE
jgi:hypothetical protein